jgi:hypothetical protein
MLWSEWEPVYEKIIEDMGYDRSSDESSARLLKAVTQNSRIVSDDVLYDIMRLNTIVVGGNVSENDITRIKELVNTTDNIERRDTVLISAGSATDVLMINGIVPDITVTDLDGDVELQKRASDAGSLMLVHAHGDNADLIMEHAGDIRGKMIITTQSKPDALLCNFGGFTDGDRAVCTARQFGSKNITLIGFDLDVPAYKDGIDTAVKKKKLAWAKKIIFGMNPSDVMISLS